MLATSVAVPPSPQPSPTWEGGGLTEVGEQPGSGREEHEGPDQGRGQVGRLELESRHREDAGHERNDRAPGTAEAADEHGPGPEAKKEPLALLDHGRMPAQRPRIQGRPFEAAPDPIRDRVAQGRPGDGTKPDRPELQAGQADQAPDGD